jgi:D-alanyl-D-alanine carboxypeptidase
MYIIKVNTMYRIISAIIVFGLICPLAFSQDMDTSKLDSYFDALQANDKFMGTVAVSRNGEVIYTRSVGYKDVESKLVSDINSKYRIGSISKTFTAALVFIAIEQGKLNLHMTIEEYFPTVKNAEKITIGHLLGHRSGIHSFTDDESFPIWNKHPKTRDEMIEIISSGDSRFEPGSRAEYSNPNYLLLTYILENIYDTPYADLLQKKIAKPLGLENTYLGGKIDTGNNECNSYRWRGQWILEPEEDISIPMGAGGVVSSALDILKFSDGLFGGKIVSSESLERMKTIVDNYGMGLFQYPFYERRCYGHTGGIDGFVSAFTYFPEDNVSYVQLSNGASINNNDISIAVLSAVFNKPYEIPEFITYTVNPEALNRYLGVYSSVQIPLQIAITREGDILVSQVSGQPSFPLEATGKDVFAIPLVGAVLEFDPNEGTMVLKQHGAEFIFSRE